MEKETEAHRSNTPLLEATQQVWGQSGLGLSFPGEAEALWGLDACRE